MLWPSSYCLLIQSLAPLTSVASETFFADRAPFDFLVTQMQSSIPTTKFFCQLGKIVGLTFVSLESRLRAKTI